MGDGEHTDRPSFHTSGGPIVVARARSGVRPGEGGGSRRVSTERE